MALSHLLNHHVEQDFFASKSASSSAAPLPSRRVHHDVQNLLVGHDHSCGMKILSHFSWPGGGPKQPWAPATGHNNTSFLSNGGGGDSTSSSSLETWPRGDSVPAHPQNGSIISSPRPPRSVHLRRVHISFGESEEKPAEGGEKPPGGENPAEGGGKEGGDKPAEGGDKPAEGAEKPAEGGGEEKSEEKKEDPSAQVDAGEV